MFLKEIFRKIKRYFRRLFAGNKTEKFDVLSSALNMVNELTSCLTGIKSHKPQCVMEVNIARRHLNLVKKSIETMRYTTDPGLFSSKYSDALLILRKVYELKSLEHSIKESINNLINIITKLSDLPTDCNETGLVYYSVTFGGKRKEYYYLPGGKRYMTGQYVLVPVGAAMEHKIARIVCIDRFTPANAPMPPESLKVIISPAII